MPEPSIQAKDLFERLEAIIYELRDIKSELRIINRSNVKLDKDRTDRKQLRSTGTSADTP